MNFYISSQHFNIHQQFVCRQRSSDVPRNNLSKSYKNINKDVIVFEMEQITVVGRKVIDLKVIDPNTVMFQEIMFDAVHRSNKLHEQRKFKKAVV